MSLPSPVVLPPSPPPPGEIVLRLTDVSKGYQEGELHHSVLSGTSLEVLRGTAVALVGPSGSGKSTLLNLAGGIDAPDAGSVEVEGVPIHSLTERERTLFRRERIGFVFQFFNLIPTLTVEEDLLLPLELKGDVSPEAADRARYLLDRVGLGNRAESWPDRLSGGEQQRIAVARALVHRPALILADEPTGNLDEATGARVMELLEELLSETGTTLVMVTHAHDLAARMDRVLRLHGGKIIEDARPGASAGEGQ